MNDFFLLAAETSGASEAPSLLKMLSTILVVIVAARFAAEIAERLSIPSVLAEIGAGIILGGSMLGLVESSETLHVLAEIGAILLLFEVGVHMDVGDLMRVGGNATRVGFIGIVAPAVATYPIAIAFGVDRDPAIFLAAAVTATSVGITARVFAEMKVLATPEARTVLGAAVLDDVLGLLILTFVTQSLGSQSGGRSLQMTVLFAVGFLIIGGALAIVGAPKFFDWVSRHGRTDGSLVVATFGFALAIAAAGTWAGLAPLVGAFLAGVAAARSDRHAEFQRRIAPVGHVIIPIFFVAVGLEVDITVFGDLHAVLLALAISVVAIATKLAGGLGVLGGKADRVLIGLGMVPRGEVGLIFATLGLTTGALDTETHASLILVVLITTAVTPPLLRWRLNSRKKSGETESGPSTAAVDCLTAEGGVVELAGRPSPDDALLVVLKAARAVADKRPGPELTEWLRGKPVDEMSWDEESREALFELLENGKERSFRVLEATGVFAQIFPSIAAEPAHGIDPYGLDPDGEAAWDGLLILHRALNDEQDPVSEAFKNLEQNNLVLLSAFARGGFVGLSAPDKARQLAASIGLSGSEAELVGELVGEANLLPAAALEPDMGREQQVLELTAHLGSDQHATALYILAAAEFKQDQETRARIDALYALLHNALTSKEGEGVDVFAARREAVRQAANHLPSEVVEDHLSEAPRRYLLTYEPSTIAVHMSMLDPAPGPNELKVKTESVRDRTRLHVVIRDRLGALAAVAHSLNNQGFTILDASAAVWPTGIAVLVFLLDTQELDNLEQLRSRLESDLRTAESVPALGKVEGHVSVDNQASPWYSIVEVRAPDREGLLAKVASAISAAGGEIVYATVTTTEGHSRDRFFVVGKDGSKLTTRDERALRSALDGKRPMRMPG